MVPGPGVVLYVHDGGCPAFLAFPGYLREDVPLCFGERSYQPSAWPEEGPSEKVHCQRSLVLHVQPGLALLVVCMDDAL